MNYLREGWTKMTWIAAFLLLASLLSSSLYAASDSKIIEAAKKDGELMLWTSSDLRTANRLVERFEQRYPFVKVKVFRTGTVALHNKVTTEALAGKHNWDDLVMEGNRSGSEYFD